MSTSSRSRGMKKGSRRTGCGGIGGVDRGEDAEGVGVALRGKTA